MIAQVSRGGQWSSIRAIGFGICADQRDDIQAVTCAYMTGINRPTAAGRKRVVTEIVAFSTT
jgi:hypothetical protein